MILTEYFINRKTEALRKTSGTRRLHYYRALDDVRHILILCDVSDWKEVEACIHTLKGMKKSVHVCIYTSEQDPTRIWDYGYLLVEAKKDIDLWGFPKKYIMEQLRHLPADMLLDLTGDGASPALRYLMLQHPAAFKVGAKHASGKDWYDFSIVLEDGMHDVPFLFRQVLNYLQMIHSKNP
ncbi:MAG: hypothetical protein LBP50_10300 [Tannerella sp.]|jgi:hypothetical protein|nr:hypothetical protein [Tannerella sp.]